MATHRRAGSDSFVNHSTSPRARFAASSSQPRSPASPRDSRAADSDDMNAATAPDRPLFIVSACFFIAPSMSSRPSLNASRRGISAASVSAARCPSSPKMREAVDTSSPASDSSLKASMSLPCAIRSCTVLMSTPSSLNAFFAAGGRISAFESMTMVRSRLVAARSLIWPWSTKVARVATISSIPRLADRAVGATRMSVSIICSAVIPVVTWAWAIRSWMRGMSATSSPKPFMILTVFVAASPASISVAATRFRTSGSAAKAFL